MLPLAKSNPIACEDEAKVLRVGRKKKTALQTKRNSFAKKKKEHLMTRLEGKGTSQRNATEPRERLV